jgi:hypothetical protein
VKLAHKVQRVRRDLKEIQEIPVQRELMVRMVRLEPRVHKVCKVQRVRRDLKGIQEIRVQRELQELLEHKEPQA